MFILASLQWPTILPRSIKMTGPGASTELVLEPSHASRDHKLQVQHAVLGLYQAGVAIAQGGKFFQLDALLYVEQCKVGWLEFRPSSDVLLGDSNVDHSTASVSLDSHSSPTTMMETDSGEVIDREDKELVITYKWDGVRIKSQDVFTVLLDALAIAAEHKNSDLDACVPAARSASGDTVMSTWTIGEKGNPHMTWLHLKRVFILLWESVIVGVEGKKARFEGFLFGINYEGKEIGAGRILRFGNDGQGLGGSVVEQ